MLEIFSMANNGYLNSSGSCIPVIDFSIYCPSDARSVFVVVYDKYLNNIESRCWNSLWTVSYSIPVPSKNCQIPGPIPLSTIPTVADGITLGWQAGGALILVGCILFLKKALK
jgi:hypothetical protein